MSRTIIIFRQHAKRLDDEAFAALTERLLDGAEVQQTDDALFASGGERALAFGKPCARMAGVLFFADRRRAWAEPVERTVPADRASDWMWSLLKEAALEPGEAEGAEMAFDLEARETEAVVFDGRERKATPATTDVLSRISLDGIPVTGPRAKIRCVMKGDETPVMLHAGVWERLSRYEERELVTEHEVASAIRERLTERKGGRVQKARLRDLRLVYWADEFSGGPDLLHPWYFAEIEMRDPNAKAKGRIQGPRHVIRVPAYR